MTKQVTLHYPIENPSLAVTPDILFISNFQFSYRHLLKELPRDIITLFHSLIQQFQNGDEAFYQIVNDEKRWDTAVRKYAHYKVKNAQFEEQFEEVHTFFNQYSSFQIIVEMTNFLSYATYRTSGDDCWFVFDDYDGEKLIPLTKERVRNNVIKFHNGSNEKDTLSPQAILYFRLLTVVLSNRLEKFKLKADLDTDLPEYIQLLLSVCNDQMKANTYFIDLKKPLTSLLEIIISYQLLSRLLTDTYEQTENEELKSKINQSILALQPIFYRLSSTCYLAFANTERQKEEKAAVQAKKKAEETQHKLDKQKTKYEDLKKQHAELKKQKKEIMPREQTHSPVIVQENSEQLKALTEERAQLQRLVTQLENTLKIDTNKYREEIERLKEENKGLQQKLQPLLKATATPKIETIEQWLALGKTLIQNINDTEEHEIRAFFELFIQLCDEQKVARPKQQLASNLFGYVSISSKGHYVHFPNGQDEIIEGLPANIYLADGQFVQVTKNHEYVQDYPDFFDFNLKDVSAQFSIVKMQDDKPYVYANGELVPLKVESYIRLRNGQIVSFNTQHELIRFYKQKRLQLNLFEQSIALKEHTPYYVQKALPTGAVVTNVLTNVEMYMTFKNGEKLKDHMFITVNDKDIIRTFNSSFYKLSSYYTKSEIVSVCEMDLECFGKKLNREIVIIKNIPSNVSITLGDNVRVDEFHHYLEVVREEAVDGETLEQRLARRPVTTTKDVSHSTAAARTTPILIVGNPSFFSSYKQKLGEYGYDVAGIDGYESFSRVKQAAKDKEYIVVCTEFVSHDNMYAIKDFYPSAKVLYSERDGATQIALQLKSANM